VPLSVCRSCRFVCRVLQCVVKCVAVCCMLLLCVALNYSVLLCVAVPPQSQERHETDLPYKRHPQMQESFSILDRDRSGVLDVQNIAESMKALGVDKKTEEIHAMVKVCVSVFVYV